MALDPFAFRETDDLEFPLTETMVADSARSPSVINQRRRLYLWGNLKEAWPTTHLISLQFDTPHDNLCVLEDAYRMDGINAAQDEVGMLSTIPFDALSGVSVIVENQEGPRYSAVSHIPQPTLIELRVGGQNGQRMPTQKRKYQIRKR